MFDKELTQYQTRNLRLFQTERVCRRQFQIRRKWKKVLQTGRKTVGKEEIAGNKQFLLFPQCFQKACFPGASKGVIVWEWVKHLQKTKVAELTECHRRVREHQGENFGPEHFPFLTIFSMDFLPKGS